jgi:hypothetical protein
LKQEEAFRRPLALLLLLLLLLLLILMISGSIEVLFYAKQNQESQQVSKHKFLCSKLATTFDITSTLFQCNV